MRKTISIISDWDKEDFYLANLRTRLQQYISGYQVSVISHHVNSFDSMQAAFILRACWQQYPEGSIHIMAVNSASSSKTPHVLIVHKNHFFIGTDMGYWQFICKEKPESVFFLHAEQNYEGSSFPELSIFVDVAAAISQGIMPKELGSSEYELALRPELQVMIETDTIIASIIYFDSYGNAITNLNKESFYKNLDNKKFNIYIVSERNQMNKIAGSYLDVKPGEFLAIFNSLNLLEIAIREGNIMELLSLEIGNQIRIEFKL
jgi:S-adenosyl-L-methionine hydrolase (adenosine-forming)